MQDLDERNSRFIGHRLPGNRLVENSGRQLLWAALLMLAVGLSGGCASVGEKADEQAGQQESSQRAAEGEAADESASGDDIDPTVVAHRDYRDPLIGLNRAIFTFNDVSYRYVLIPLGKGYVHTVPEPAQQSVSNFFFNIQAPIYVVNNVLQLKPKAAGTNLLRFGINTTIGLLGLFDPAAHWFEIERAPSTFEDTFAHYGAGYGFYLVLPLLGSSDLRNGTSALAEGFLHPISYLVDDTERIVIQSFDYFQEFAPQAERYEDLVNESDDPYIFMRNFYLQGVQRDAEAQQD